MRYETEEQRSQMARAAATQRAVALLAVFRVARSLRIFFRYDPRSRLEYGQNGLQQTSKLFFDEP